MENWLDACENRWLRRIMRIAYKDSITNETIRQRVPMSNRSRQMRLKWFGHVLWMKVNTLTKSVYLMGKRSRGRLNKRWMDCIEENQGSMTIRCNKVWKNSRKTMNHTERHCCRQTTWRNLTVASMAEICWTTVKIKNTLSHPVFVTSGVPQGSCLGPTLFLLKTVSQITPSFHTITLEVIRSSFINNLVDLMYHCTVLPIESLIFGITCL